MPSAWRGMRPFVFTMRITWMPFGTPGRSWFFSAPCRRDASPQRWTASIRGGGDPGSRCPSVVPTGGSARSAIRAALQDGVPTVAECGRIFVFTGAAADGAGGSLAHGGEGRRPGMGYPTRQLRRFGYLTLQAERDSLLFRAGEEIPAHEFHHWDSTQTGTALLAQKPSGKALAVRICHRHPLCGLSPSPFWGRASFGGTLCVSGSGLSGKETEMTWKETLEKIQAGEETARAQALRRWDSLAKPLGSLGILEEAIVRIAALTGTAEVCLKNRALVVLCADNGVVSQGVSQSDASVTRAVIAALGNQSSTVNDMAQKCKLPGGAGGFGGTGLFGCARGEKLSSPQWDGRHFSGPCNDPGAMHPGNRDWDFIGPGGQRDRGVHPPNRGDGDWKHHHLLCRGQCFAGKGPGPAGRTGLGTV